jgi:hypothetical protein
VHAERKLANKTFSFFVPKMDGRVAAELVLERKNITVHLEKNHSHM